MQEISEYIEHTSSSFEGVLTAEEQRSMRLIEQALDESSDEKAILLLKEAIALFPENVQAYLFLGIRLESGKEAIECYKKVIDLFEENFDLEDEFDLPIDFWEVEGLAYAQALHLLADIYHFQEKSEKKEAINLYKKIIHFYPTDPDSVRDNLISIFFVERMDREFFALVEQFQSCENSSYFLYTHALWLYLKQGNSIEALSVLKKAMRKDPSVPKRIEKCREIFQLLNPAKITHEQALDLLEEVDLGELLLWTSYHEALNWLEVQSEKFLG